MESFKASLSGKQREFRSVATITPGGSIPTTVAQLNLKKVFMASDGSAKKIKRLENLVEFVQKANKPVKVGHLLY